MSGDVDPGDRWRRCFIDRRWCAISSAITMRGVVNVDALTYAADLRNLASIERNAHYHFEQVDICGSSGNRPGIQVP